jgi:hypothetical protein
MHGGSTDIPRPSNGVNGYRVNYIVPAIGTLVQVTLAIQQKPKAPISRSFHPPTLVQPTTQ